MDDRAGNEKERSSQPGLKSLVAGSRQGRRQRVGIGGELVLALLPTLTVLAVLFLVESFSRQRLLFASLASSAFLIYLDPRHGTNSLRTLMLSQFMAALIGFGLHELLGETYQSAGLAMVATIVLMIVLDAVHPPAVATALGFAFRNGPESNLVLFGAALLLVGVLVVLARVTTFLLLRLEPRPVRENPS